MKGKWKLYLACPTGHWASTLYIFQVYFLECVQILWSCIQACPRKYASTCQRISCSSCYKWNIIKHTIFQGQVKVGVGQVNVEFRLPYWALLGKLPQKLMLCPDGLMHNTHGMSQYSWHFPAAWEELREEWLCLSVCNHWFALTWNYSLEMLRHQSYLLIGWSLSAFHPQPSSHGSFKEVGQYLNNESWTKSSLSIIDLLHCTGWIAFSLGMDSSWYKKNHHNFRVATVSVNELLFLFVFGL